MKITEVDDVFKYVKVKSPCGLGTTAICFLTKDNRVLKLYLNTYRTKKLIDSSFLDKLNKINSIQNDTFVGPDEVLVHDDRVIGYLYPYIKSSTLKKINLNTRLNDITNSLDKLLTDTKDISDNCFNLYDVHSGNILFNGEYKVIDLDWGKISKPDNLLYLYNMRKIFFTINHSIFNATPKDILIFKDANTRSIYRATNWTDINSINEFYASLEEECKINNPTVKQLRKTINKEKVYNSYYKPGI